jgi:hypothetical protein
MIMNEKAIKKDDGHMRFITVIITCIGICESICAWYVLLDLLRWY